MIAAVARDTELEWHRSIYDSGVEAPFISILGNEELRDGATLPVGMPLSDPTLRDRFLKMKVQGSAALFLAFKDRLLLDPMMVAMEETHELEPAYEPLRVDWVLQDILGFVRDTAFPAMRTFFD